DQAAGRTRIPRLGHKTYIGTLGYEQGTVDGIQSGCSYLVPIRSIGGVLPRSLRTRVGRIRYNSHTLKGTVGVFEVGAEQAVDGRATGREIIHIESRHVRHGIHLGAIIQRRDIYVEDLRRDIAIG